MVLKTEENLTFNSENCIRRRRHMRVTEESVGPRVLLKKTELPCTQRHNRDAWFNYVTVEKYIDGTLVKTYHWIQDIDQEELAEFLKIDREVERTPRNPDDPRVEYFREYYKLHKEEIKERQRSKRNGYYREWYEKNRKKKLEQCRLYQQTHKEQISLRNKLNKLKKLCQDQQKDNSSEELS